MAARRWRHIIRWLSLALAAALMLTACGTETTADKNATKNVTLTWWTWTGDPQAAISNFEKKYPSIKVNYLDVGGGTTEYTKLRTALDAGSGAPDVVQIEYYELPSFIATQKLLNLAPYVANDASDYPKWVWNQVTRGKKVYAMPEDIGPMGLVYEPELLKKYGLTLPETWAEFAQDAAKLHKEDPGEYMIESPTGVGQAGWLIGLLWQAGASLFHLQQNGTWDISINTPTTRRVLQYWVGLVQRKLIDPGNESSVAYDHNIAEAQYVAQWGAAWSPSGIASFVTPSKPQKFAVGQLPQWTAGGQASANNGGSSNAVPLQSSHPKAAALFASFINTSESGINVDITPYIASGDGGGRGLFPAATARSAVPGFKSVPPDFAASTQQVFNVAAQHVNTNFQWSPWSLDLEAELGVEASLAAAGTISVAEALAATQSAIITYAEQDGDTVKVVP
jgi:multiple sugar transport system substrate-binding protein